MGGLVIVQASVMVIYFPGRHWLVKEMATSAVSGAIMVCRRHGDDMIATVNNIRQNIHMSFFFSLNSVIIFGVLEKLQLCEYMAEVLSSG